MQSAIKGENRSCSRFANDQKEETLGPILWSVSCFWPSIRLIAISCSF
jgi:hypothetical protein